VDFSLSDDQQALRDLARKILEDRATNERLRALERAPERFDRELWSDLAKANLLGVALPESVGGSGLGWVELALLLQEVGRAVAPVPALATLALGAAPLAELGSDAQRARWLPGVVAGACVLTAALVEPGGVDPRRPALRAARDGRGWRLSGTKTCVPWAPLSERVLTTARTGDGSAGVFLVDPRARGVTLSPQETTNGEPQAELALADVAVPAEDALGDPVAGFGAAERLVEHALAGICATQLGVTERMLERTAAYGRERRQFDRPIGSFQAFHQRAADAAVNVEALRLSTWQAVWRLAQGLPAQEELWLAKYWAGEPAYRVAYACSHLHGGIGSDTDYPLHRYYLWTKQLELAVATGMDALRVMGRSLAETA
jgi:alkylation response protein AidB-like acyl-CoA dehydrogenase